MASLQFERMAIGGWRINVMRLDEVNFNKLVGLIGRRSRTCGPGVLNSLSRVLLILGYFRSIQSTLRVGKWEVSRNRREVLPRPRDNLNMGGV